MSLYLWDNGEIYDAHQVIMVDVESARVPASALVAFLDALGKCMGESNGRERGGILAVIDRIEWRQRPTIEHAFDVILGQSWHWTIIDGAPIGDLEPSDELRAFDRPLVALIETLSGAKGLAAWIFDGARTEVTPS